MPDGNGINYPVSLINANFTCIARFNRQKSYTDEGASAIATIRYLSKRTSLPLPEIYAFDLDPDNDIGAAVVLMERLPGKPLYRFFDDLSLDHKKAVITQISDLIVQFASVKFDKIGCLTPEGRTGPLITRGRIIRDDNSIVLDTPARTGGPFENTIDYMHHHADPESAELPELQDLYRETLKRLDASMEGRGHTMFDGPFAIRHIGPDGYGILFTQPSDGSPPKLTGLVDFEYTHSTPLWWVCDYPTLIQDDHMEPECYEDNAVLRPYLVSEMLKRLPTAEARTTFIDSLNATSCLAIHEFSNCFMDGPLGEEARLFWGQWYVKDMDGEDDGLAPGWRGPDEYYGQDGWPGRKEALRWIRDSVLDFVARLKSFGHRSGKK
ncbi:hypothetical protein F5X68DRAFT_236984 [Plectosphaerella plurivora]|uniref:Aminoglycoside phosphotransferase domain-containing protein n=1 Tax=Plectosphaerella plurivora TaxID=936078 RepID=A0A9P9A428_9PEZI|nr:hypothetical protein F5X68DRAFT_236984 [Plectosphaerella plurivora]